jgi:Flp pilus assembly pilin Flp
MKIIKKRKSGQAMVEYIIIVAVVAVAVLALFGLFGDVLKKKLGGAVDELDEGGAGAAAATEEQAVDQIKSLGND